VEVCAGRLEDAARSGANLMPRILTAVGLRDGRRISDAMRRVFGEYKEAVVI